MTMRNTILGCVADLVSDFLCYARKEDEDLPLGVIEEAIRSGDVSIDDICNRFREKLVTKLKDVTKIDSMPKKVYEGMLKFRHFEDGGCAALTDFEEGEGERESGMFVHILSWNEDADGRRDMDQHEELAKFIGKKIRVTVEVI